MNNRQPITRILAGLLSLALILTLIPLGGVPARAAPPAQNGSPAVFINEIHYDNASTDVGEAIEIAGPAGTDLTGWSIVLYNGANGSAYDTTALSGPILDQQNGFGTLYFSYPTNGIQNGSPDGIALVSPGDNVVQFLSYEGSFTAIGGPADGMASTDIGVSEGSSTPVGDSLQLTGTGTVYDNFSWAGPAPNTFGEVNTGQTFEELANQPVIVNCGPPLVTFQGNAASTAVSATDADGKVVDIAITDISPAPASGTIILSDLAPAEEVGGTASATVTVAASAPPGTYSVEITATNDDAEPQTGKCTLSVTVNEVLTIGQVQGEVTDNVDGLTFDSPYDDQYVTIQGVIYENTLSRTSSGYNSHGFFIQNSLSTADGNPWTSDGIFVYIGGYSTLRIRGGGYYTPQVGDEVILNGRISEYYHLTELYNPYLEMVVPSDVELDTEVPAFEVNPPTDLADANRYWERHEGMRAEVPAGSLAISGRDVFAGTLDGEAWFIRADSAVAQRTDPYARRVFRDPHPLDDIPEELFDNGNGYRIVLGSMGIKATQNDNTALIAPVRTFDSMNEAAIGGVYFSYSKYQIMVDQQLEYTNGVDPSLNNPPEDFDQTREYSIVTFNMENLYDYRNDPFSGCDFLGDPGCPGVEPPFDYVPASEDAYFTRVDEIAGQIVGALHSPDVIMAQEIENQDICSVVDEAVVCGDTNNADGQPDALEDLAVAIFDLGGPIYVSAFDRDGADDRGIVSAFLYRSDRAELLPAAADNPVLGDDPQVVYPSEPLPYNTDVQNPKALNAVLPDFVDTSTGVDGPNVFTRAPEVGYFRMWREGVGASVFTDLYLIDNHFSSGPDIRVGQRTEQAAYNAAIVAALQAAFPGVYVSVGGDLNVYPRPDDPFEPGSPLYPSDQLAALYNQGMTNLYDFLVTEVPVSAYSYVYQGQAQTLDQMFVTPSLLGDLANFRASHINSDFPSDYFGDGPRGTSDHDPQVARYTLLPTLDRLMALVHYYDASGDITGNNTSRILLDRLERAQRYKDAGQQQAYRAQLQAFINQVQGFAPRFIEQSAADALVQEVMLLQTL